MLVDNVKFYTYNKKYNDIETLYGLKNQVSINDMMAIYAGIKKKEEWVSLNGLSRIAKKEHPHVRKSICIGRNRFSRQRVSS
ncbi:hypothetical protein [Galbibacter pacificus]|nr:hypothetical protein [Galbibacter pacificus]